MTGNTPERTYLNADDVGVPHWGYEYSLVNDTDAVAGQPAHVAVKLGASHALERRQKSFPNPIDLDGSFVVRFADWNAAYAFEQRLHTDPNISSHRWPDFLVLNEYWNTMRQREGEAGRYEWFSIQSLGYVRQILKNPDMQKMFGWSQVIPASEVMLYKQRPDISKRRAGYVVGQQVLDDLFSMGACRLTAFVPTPVNDRFSVMLSVPENNATLALIHKGQGVELPYLDGRGVPLFGHVARLPGQRLVHLPFMMPNAIERGREGPHINFVRAIMKAPTAGKVSRPVAHAAALFTGLPGARVNGELPINLPSPRKLVAASSAAPLFDALPENTGVVPK